MYMQNTRQTGVGLFNFPAHIFLFIILLLSLLVHQSGSHQEMMANSKQAI